MPAIQKLRNVALVVATAALLVGSAGCGKIADKASEQIAERIIEKQTGGKVDIQKDGEKIKIETDEGTITGGASIPDGWPSDIPLPKDLRVIGGSAIKDGDQTVYSVAGSSSASRDEIKNLYANALSDWKLEHSMDLRGEDESTMLSYSKGDRMALITISEHEKERNLSVTVQDQPKG